VVNVALADASVSVNNDTLNLLVKGTFDLEATTVPSGLNVSYSSTNESVVTVNSEGKVTAVGAGNATIVVTVGDDKVYAINSTNVGVNVKIPTAIDDILIPELRVGNKFTLRYILVDSNTGSTIREKLEYTVTSTNESVVKAYIDDWLVIECVGEGNANVTAGFAGNDKYAAAENKTFTLTVKKIPTEISVENSTVNLKANDEIPAGATLTPADAGNVTYTSSNSSVAVVDGGKIKALAEGSANITVSFAGNDTYAAAENKTIVVNVALADASVSVNNDTLNLLVKGTFDLEATTVPSGLNVSYSSTNESVVTVNSEGKVTAVGAGNATIVVTVGDDKVYAINSTNVGVNVKIPTAIDDILIPELRVGNKFTLRYILVDSNTGSTIREKLEYTVTSTNESVVKAYIDDWLVIECVGEGNANVTAGFAGNDKYAAAENKTFTLTVKKIPTEISVANSTVDMKVKEEIESGASLTPANAGNVTYTSSNSSVAIVKDGKIIAVGEGSANITVSFAGDNKYATAENKTITVNVSLNDASLSVDNSTLDLFVGDYYTLTVNTVPEGLNVTFTPDNSGVVSVDENGKVTALKEGEGSVRVSVGGDGVYEFKSIDVTVTVKKIPTEISVANSTVDLKVNDEIDAGASLTPADAGNVSYTSSNSSVAVVEGGKIKALAEGNATITVSFAGDNTYAAAENKTIAVNISLNEASLSVDNYTLDLFVGDYYTLTVVTVPEGLNVTFTPDNSGVVSVENGTVTALKEGNAVVKVSVGGDGVYEFKSIDVTVTVKKIPTEIEITNSTVDMKVNEEIESGATLTPADAGNVTYTSTNSSVAVVENGKIKALAEGSANITVSFAGNDTYAAAENKTIAVTVTLNDASLSVNNDTLDLLIDDEFVLVVTTVPEGLDVTFTPDNSGVVSVDENGVVTALKEGTAAVKVSVGGDGVYALNTTDVTVTVKKIPTEIILNNDTLDMHVGDVAENVASLTPSTGDNVTYISSNSSVVKVEDGKIVAVGNGTAVVIVNYNGSDKYESANSKVIVVNVTKVETSIIVGDDIDMKVGDSAVVNATLSPADAGALKYISSDEKVAKIVDNNIVAVGEGKATITVSFTGDDKYAAAENRTIKVTVVQRGADMNVTVPNAVKVGDNFNVTVALPEDAEGNVTVKVDGKEVATVPVENGAVCIPLENLNPGAHLIETSYSGDGKYVSASDAKAMLVENETQPEDNNITVIVDGKEYPAELVNGTAVVETNATEPDRNITVVVDGKEYPAELVNGTAVVETNATEPDRNITVVVVKKDTFIEVESAFTRVANDYYANERGALFYAVLKDSDGNILANKKVSIAVNGPIYNVTTDNKGRAGLQVNFMVANVYTYALAFEGDDEYNAAPLASSKLTITKKSISISASSKSFKAKAKKTIKVTLKAAKNPYDGKVYLKSGKKVTLKVNGKKYKVKANAKGVAKFTIKLTKKGKYIAKINFAGDKTYKAATKSIKITIK